MLLDDGTVRCWGRAAGGVLGGDQYEGEVLVPTAVPGITDAAAIAVDRSRSCVVHRDGTVSCWGDALVFEKDGVLVTGGSTTPRKIPGMTDVRTMVLGAVAACALRNDGSSRCWGDDRNALHPRAKTPASDPFFELATSRDTDTLVLGGGHACVLESQGSVHCWGSNRDGQLATGDTKPRSLPAPVKGLPSVVALAASENLTCALGVDGSAWCWGGTRCPPTGDCSVRDFAVKRPVLIATPTPMVAIAMRGGDALLRAADGTVHRFSPLLALAGARPSVLALPIDRVVELGIGLPSCGRKRDGTIVCWRDDGVPEPVAL